MRTIEINGGDSVDIVVEKLETALNSYVKRRYTYDRMNDKHNVKFMDECIARTKAAIRKAKIERFKQAR